MKYRQIALLSAAVLAAACGADTQSVTVNAVTYLDENASVIWRTIKASPAKIALDWPNGAASAVLTTKAGSRAAQSAVIDDTSATSCDVVFAMPARHDDREVVSLTISYRDSSDAELKSKTVRLGLVDGVENGASVATSTDSGAAECKRFDTHEVVQIPPDATSVTLDGAAVDCDIPGWYDLAPSLGSHTLEAVSETGTLTATVIKSGGGILIIFR